MLECMEMSSTKLIQNIEPKKFNFVDIAYFSGENIKRGYPFLYISHVRQLTIANISRVFANAIFAIFIIYMYFLLFLRGMADVVYIGILSNYCRLIIV
jgi:hypothetical protein